MAGQAEGVAAGDQIGAVGRAMRRVTTYTRKAIAADGVEAVRQIAVAGIAEGVCAVAQQAGAVAVMADVTARALLWQLRGVLGCGKAGNGGGVTLTAKLCGCALEQTYEGAVVRQMAGRTIATTIGRMRHRAAGKLMAIAANIGFDRRQAGGLIAVELRVTFLAFAALHRLVRAGGLCRQHIRMTLGADLRQFRAEGLRLVRVVAGRASRDLVGGVSGKAASGVKLMIMASAA